MGRGGPPRRPLPSLSVSPAEPPSLAASPAELSGIAGLADLNALLERAGVPRGSDVQDVLARNEVDGEAAEAILVGGICTRTQCIGPVPAPRPSHDQTTARYTDEARDGYGQRPGSAPWAGQRG